MRTSLMVVAVLFLGGTAHAQWEGAASPLDARAAGAATLAADGSCSSWRVAQVDDDGKRTCTGTFSLIRSGNALTGGAQWDCIGPANITGTIEGGRVHLSLAYEQPAGLIGYYDAQVGPDGRTLVQGTTQGSSGGTANWSATAAGACTAPCGGWRVTQVNDAGAPTCTGIFNVGRYGDALFGTATWDCIGPATIVGTMAGRRFKVALHYAQPAGLVGYYHAELSPEGNALLRGETHSSQGGKANWTAVKGVCADR